MRAGMSGGMGIATIFVILGIIVVLLIVVAVIVVLAVVLSRGNNNKYKPQVTVSAFVIGKRENATGYFVAFQLESGERVELSVDNGSYGLLSDGDRGILSFQGTKYLGFQRNY